MCVGHIQYDICCFTQITYVHIIHTATPLCPPHNINCTLPIVQHTFNHHVSMGKINNYNCWPLGNLSVNAVMDNGTNGFLKGLSLHLWALKRLPEGRSLYSEWRTRVGSEIICWACLVTVSSKRAWSVGCCLTPVIFMSLCVSRVIWAFKCTLRLPNQAEMPYLSITAR